MTKINEKEVREFYNFFPHENPTEIRVFDKVKYPQGKSVFVNSEDEFVQVVQGFNETEKIDVYIRGRDGLGKTDEGISESRHIFLEIDEHDLKKPLEKEKLEGFFKKHDIKISLCGMSGGGYHFYIKHSRQIFNSNEDRKEFKEILLKFREVLINAKIDIDPVCFNLSRVSRVLGTYNYKRKAASEIIYNNLDINSEENNIGIRNLIASLPETAQDSKVNETAVELLEKYKINETDKWFYDLVKNKIMIGEDSGGNSIIFKNAAVIMARDEILKEEVKVIGKAAAELCKGRTLSAFMGWYSKALKNELGEVNEIEINKCIDNANYKLTKYSQKFIKDKKKLIPKDTSINKGETKNNISLEHDEEAPDRYLLHDNPKDPKKITGVKIDLMASDIMEEIPIRTIHGIKSDECYIFREGYYQPKGKEFIKIRVEELGGNSIRVNHVNEVFEKIKRLTATSEEDFNNIPPHLIPLNDCVYNSLTNEVLENNSKYLFRIKVPVNYVEKATCPAFLKFLKDTLYPDDIPVIQEWFGFSLFRKYFLKKALIFVGEKDTGKTVLLNVYQEFLSFKNISGMSLQRISEGDKFGLSHLKEKLANVFDDLSTKDIYDGGGFKMATGGSYITAEKKFGDSFTFLTFAKHLFGCNKIPPTKDPDDMAYYDRWLPICFDNALTKEEIDPFLIEKLTTEKELEGILIWALEGLERLLLQKQFSYKKTLEEVKNIFERSSNTLSIFVQDCLVQNPDGRMSKDEMFEGYTKWALENKTQRCSKEQLGRNLMKYAKYIIDKKDKKSGRFWSGVLPSMSKEDTFPTFFTTIYQYSNNKKISYSDIIYIIRNKLGKVGKEKQQKELIPDKEIPPKPNQDKKEINEFEGVLDV